MHHHAAKLSSVSDNRSFFANRVIRSILFSAVFLQLGIWIRNFAILLFVTEQTNKDPIAVSLISVAEYAPIFIFSFIGGAFADRWRPKRTMVACDLLSAASVFIVLLALIVGGWQAIFFATLVSSILSQFSQPAGMKLFKLHVPASQMQKGMSLYQTIQAVFMILGPVLGTLVYFYFGIQTTVVIMGICFVLSAAVLTTLPKDRTVPSVQPTRLTQDIKSGLQYVMANKIFLYMASFFLAAGLALGLINPLGIYVITEHLGLKAEHLQWFTAMNGVGIILGGMLMMALSRRMPPRVMLLIGFVCSGAAVALIGTTTSIGVAFTAQFAAGLLVPFIHISCQTLMMSHADEAYVGRVSGIMSPIFIGGMVLTMSIVGILKASLPLGVIYGLSAVLFLAGAIGVVPLLRHKQPAPSAATAHSGAFHH
ncbi:MFS transporter [Paenibacillus barengoltzii]|uniref:MFS transporter n=1 Tax=Paenibacillus barengoltzii TaxID=343517 RepID=UPI002DBA0F0F|nr:MFS transporter [Paenibacillus barengoltzii]MEC2343076.1 MFS transporter [Paenibacillus barengoltzii]